MEHEMDEVMTSKEKDENVARTSEDDNEVENE